VERCPDYGEPATGCTSPNHRGSQGKGATTIKFDPEPYFFAFGGMWDCAGIRIENSNVVKDVFECTVSDPSTLPAGVYNGTNIPWLDDSGGPIWGSDLGDGLTTHDLDLVVSPTGHVRGIAYY
jgi:hypothetical protein